MNYSKYDLYEASVIDAKDDVSLFRKIYRSALKRDPKLYREDFCGALSHATEWVKLGSKHHAWALDLAPEPLTYGLMTHVSKLSSAEQNRLHIFERNVIDGIREKTDLITAMNFSYSCLKKREDLKAYFESSYRSLKSKGVFLIDAIGGSQMLGPSMDRRLIDWGKGKPRLKYFWEQKNFDPITHEAKFAIHFELGPKKKKFKNAFTYDWRIWTIPELRDLMREAGYSKTVVYWEGTTRSGVGNGIFEEKEHEESCEVWIAYIAGIKN